MMTQGRLPILVLDFDGVLHSYTSGWQGAAVIPDPPVPWAMDFLLRAVEEFEVHILSSRSHQWGGRRAMKRWIRAELFKATLPVEADDCYAALKFPRIKPAAMLTIDDRALTFTGTWPTMQELRRFQPWNKRSL